MNTQPFDQIGQIIELSSEYLSVRCIWLYLLVMSHMHFRVNPHSIVNPVLPNGWVFVYKLSGLECGYWLSVRLRTKWFWVRIQLQSLKLQISCLLRARSFLDIQATIECGFTLKHIRDMTRTYSYKLDFLQFYVYVFYNYICLDCSVDLLRAELCSL